MLHLAVDLVAAAPGGRRSTWPPSPRRTPSTTCSAPPTPSGCSRWRAGPRWPPCPASGPARSTTSWSRWRSSGPAPSRAAPSTPTCGAGAGEEPVTYLHPLLEPSLAKTLGRAPVPGAAHADGHRRGRLLPGRGRPAPPGHGLQALPRADGPHAGPAHGGHGRQRDHRGRWPRRSPTSSRPSPTSASPRATRCPSPTWSTPARGSSCTTRPSSPPPCSTPSPWGSTRRTRSCATPGRHGVTVLGPDVVASATDCTLEPARRTTASTALAVRLGLRYVRNLGNGLLERIDGGPGGRRALPRHGGLRPAHRRPHRRPRGAGHRRGLRVLRPRPAGRRCGRRPRCGRPGRPNCPAWSPGSRRRPCPA